MNIRTKKGLSFDDVLLVPQYSTVRSRLDVHLSTRLSRNIQLAIPIVSANMDTVTESSMAIAMARLGGMGIIHRFMSPEQQASEVDKVVRMGLSVGAAIGVRDGWHERALLLLAAGANPLLIDIAHGHSIAVLEVLTKLKKMTNADIIAGNVATWIAVEELAEAGADAVKVGVGPGSVCTTRRVTGFGVPQLTAIAECAETADKYDIPIIADGGVRNSGDLAKSLAAGASSVMLGGLLAGAEESRGRVIQGENGIYYKNSRGMASESVLRENGWERTPEGREVLVPYSGPVSKVIDDLLGGLRSALSYGGALTIEEFQLRAEFIRISDAGRNESHL